MCREQSRAHSSPVLPSHRYKHLKANNQWDAEHVAPSAKEQSKHDKLKEELTKWPHEYIRECTNNIAYTLTCLDA